MNTTPVSVVGILDRLSIGVSRTSIRHYAAPKKLRIKKHHLTGFKPGHGEQIFVYNHIENGMIVYSHNPELRRDENRALRQIPFTVKKQKPPVLRRDYWQPLCMIQFDKGAAMVGRNVFRQLREFRRLHELQWGWQAPELRKMDKRTRGAAIHNQKSNAVADIAAVLAGVGRGNLMWTTPEQKPEDKVEEKEEEEKDRQVAAEESAVVKAVRKASGKDAKSPGKKAKAGNTTKSKPANATAETDAKTSDASEVALKATPSAPAPTDRTAVAKAPKVQHVQQKKKVKVAPPVELPKTLAKATVYWSNDYDLDWARSWSDNVMHHVGLPDGVTVWNWKTKIVRKDLPEEDADEDVDEVADEPEPAPVKKSWLGSLIGKVRGVGQEARV